MKIKQNYYGVFYNGRNGKLVGPYLNLITTKKGELNSSLVGRRIKKTAKVCKIKMQVES
jgi:hypothetical protein